MLIDKITIKEDNTLTQIKKLWLENRDKIQARLDEFKKLWAESDNRKIFKELIFCLFTPQSKAKSCWDAVEKLDKKGLIDNCRKERICRQLNKVRFKNNKTKYLILAKKCFSSSDKQNIKSFIQNFCTASYAREWLVLNIKGLGYKEASHFLRNIGFSDNLAILDRHILRNLQKLGIIDKIPNCLTKKEYLNIENKMQDFSQNVNIPLNHLDLLLWFKETGEIFK